MSISNTRLSILRLSARSSGRFPSSAVKTLSSLQQETELQAQYVTYHWTLAPFVVWWLSTVSVLILKLSRYYFLL